MNEPKKTLRTQRTSFLAPTHTLALGTRRTWTRYGSWQNWCLGTTMKPILRSLVLAFSDSLLWLCLCLTRTLNHEFRLQVEPAIAVTSEAPPPGFPRNPCLRHSLGRPNRPSRRAGRAGAMRMPPCGGGGYLSGLSVFLSAIGRDAHSAAISRRRAPVSACLTSANSSNLATIGAVALDCLAAEPLSHTR